MSIRINNVILYHGTAYNFEAPVLGMNKQLTDFGDGFYLTTDRRQAINWAKRCAYINENANRMMGRYPTDNLVAYVNKYQFYGITGLKIKQFDGTDEEWLRFICMNRNFPTVAGPNIIADIIAGKVADDQTALTLNKFANGWYGGYGEDVIKRVIKSLKPENLANQICIKTPEALNRLRYVGKDIIYFEYDDTYRRMNKNAKRKSSK